MDESNITDPEEQGLQLPKLILGNRQLSIPVLLSQTPQVLQAMTPNIYESLAPVNAMYLSNAAGDSIKWVQPIRDIRPFRECKHVVLYRDQRGPSQCEDRGPGPFRLGRHM